MKIVRCGGELKQIQFAWPRFGTNDRTVHRMQAKPQRSGQLSIRNLSDMRRGLRVCEVVIARDVGDSVLYHSQLCLLNIAKIGDIADTIREKGFIGSAW
jgi:hypothetical protein